MKHERKRHNHPNIDTFITPAVHALHSSTGYGMYLNNLPAEYLISAKKLLPCDVVPELVQQCGSYYTRWKLSDGHEIIGFITPRRAGMAVWLRGDSWDEPPPPAFTTLFQAALYAAKRIKYEGLNHA